tara:strand:+ start:255 stop:1415 length:1161 start_codon:yes stop_codon:yes gene_type:complete
VKKLIFGYGITGKSVEKYFQKNNIDYLVFDDNREIKVSVDKFFNKEKISEIDEVIISPGIKPSNPLLQDFNNLKIPVKTDIDLFNNHYSNKIIGVTGTNGKTTFVNLLADFINSQGFSAISLGNVGKSPLDVIGDEYDYLILELSSFQLYYINNINLYLAVILNIQEDHLDWHINYEDYEASKLKIKKFLLDKKYEAFISNEKIVNIDSKYDLNKLPFFYNLSEMFFKTIKQLNFDLDSGYSYLINSKNQEHRYEFLEKIDGVTYINDSKATNFHAVSMATTKVENGILIMHGLTKNISSEQLNISSNIKTILIPKDMKVDLNKFSGKIIYLKNIFELEKELIKIIIPGDTVLFSSGGASFNDFTNYQERGNFFKKIVSNIKHSDE